MVQSASHNNTVRPWDSRANSRVATTKCRCGLVSFVTFSPDGSKLALADDEAIELWDGATGVHIVTLRGVSSPVSTIAFSMDGSKLTSASSGRTIFAPSPTLYFTSISAPSPTAPCWAVDCFNRPVRTGPLGMHWPPHVATIC